MTSEVRFNVFKDDIEGIRKSSIEADAYKKILMRIPIYRLKARRNLKRKYKSKLLIIYNCRLNFFRKASHLTIKEFIQILRAVPGMNVIATRDNRIPILDVTYDGKLICRLNLAGVSPNMIKGKIIESIINLGDDTLVDKFIYSFQKFVSSKLDII